MTRILAIETSCDETAIAIAEFSGPATHPAVRVRSHIVLSQVQLHAPFGGVVPNLARREHEKNLVPILMQALREAKIMNQEISKNKHPESLASCFLTLDTILAREPELNGQLKKNIAHLPAPDIDAIAVTYGPGLAPALWTGINFAKALAALWKKPVIPTNHMAGHLYSALLEPDPKKGGAFFMPRLSFPALALLVSGGHTELILMRAHGKFRILGQTLDDAAGEAFDKTARILGLPYPGGPEIARLAADGRHGAYPLPRPMLNTKDYHFSFSGLKTAALYLVRDIGKLTLQKKKDIAASFQAAALEVLVKKTIRAAKEYRAKTVLLGGGVAANDALRSFLRVALKKESPQFSVRFPVSSLCGDNALMIAAAAYFCGTKKALDKVRADANARLDAHHRYG
ncbi:MAG: tRNA (adenosine(37)-N6)-threonylcarbamoyltransferase complex transferase subunit TsaD [Candidatus Sungbacteria bacterium]|uniref:tRNA N6-adenosine threonylcarbamoyltransferase n=1 Tax=Candidatus Sungiibacteriota bacterium TaxID=2750080 RepID=A0A932QXZ6_9BACT|nr:tRNA (adenosine(37)-N6)-threonylcarbamoyltransferase complex transferase subunit TsaD [Candidatus Sungbacteria bacterium]